MCDYFVHELVPGSCKVDLYSTKKTDKYTFEATVRYRQYGPFGRVKNTEYQKLYIYR